MGILHDRMIEEMKLRNFSPATQESYVYTVSRLAKYHKKSPDQHSQEDIRDFLVHLTVERKLSPNSLTGYGSGLRFFYNETLGWDESKLFIPPRKKPSVLEATATERGLRRESFRQAPVIDGLGRAGCLSAAGSSKKRR